ncbi:MAG: substrate-binding domain-containing protein, partial [Armatimonadota bacterium]
DGLPLAAQMDVPITSIVYPLEEMCRKAVEMLRTRLESAANGGEPPLAVRHQSFPARLAVRASSAPVTGSDCPESPNLSSLLSSS